MKKLYAIIVGVVLLLFFTGCVDSNSKDGNMDDSQVQNFNVVLEVDCSANLLFSRYDIEIFIDSEKLGTIDHGENKIFELQLSEGKHTLTIEEESNSSVDGSIDFSVSKDVKLKYQVSCKSDQVKIELIAEEFATTETDKNLDKITDVTSSQSQVETQDTDEVQTSTSEVEDMPSLEEKLESTFPKENARRAIIVAMTNCYATDVFTSDGNSYDPTKFHKYPETSSYMTLYKDGIWSAKNENTWTVESLKLSNVKYSNYVKVDAEVSFDGTNYILTSGKSVLGPLDSLDSEDPSKVSIENFNLKSSYLTISANMIEGTLNSVDATTSTTDSETLKRQKWINSQFSWWDGSHDDFEKLIKKNLNNEKSYKHIDTSHIDVYDEAMVETVNGLLVQMGFSDKVAVGDILIITEFSAKNGYNATIKATAYGISSYKYKTLTLVGFI